MTARFGDHQLFQIFVLLEAYGLREIQRTATELIHLAYDKSLRILLEHRRSKGDMLYLNITGV